MKEIKQFVDKLFKPYQKTPETLDTIEKLNEMLTEKVEDLIEQGIEKSEAIHKTIVEFGELDEIYKDVLKQEKRRYKRQKTIQHYRNDLLFSSLSTLFIIGLFLFINLQYITNYGLWFIIPSIGILFWPLSLLYKLLNKKTEK